MTIAIPRAIEINTALQQFSMTAALDNMARYGSQLCMAPSEAGLLDHATSELGCLLAMARESDDDHCSAACETALRQSLKGVKISMAAGSSGGREIDALLRDAAERYDADGVELPCIAAFPVMWRRDPLGIPRAHRALITPSQIDAAPAIPRGGERKLVKTILEARYGGVIHQMKHVQLVDSFIPGPIHEGVKRHEVYFAGVTGRPIPDVPTDEREIMQMLQDRAARKAEGMRRSMPFLQFHGRA